MKQPDQNFIYSFLKTRISEVVLFLNVQTVFVFFFELLLKKNRQQRRKDVWLHDVQERWQ